MPPSRVFLAGYQGRSAQHLYEIAIALGATVLDIRLKPFSSIPEWNGAALRSQMGGYYDHIGAWGNTNYAHRDQSPSERLANIAIADFEAGLARFEAMSGPVILLCVCKDPYTCHRWKLADLLRPRGYEYHHLPWSQFALPDATQPGLF